MSRDFPERLTFALFVILCAFAMYLFVKSPSKQDEPSTEGFTNFNKSNKKMYMLPGIPGNFSLESCKSGKWNLGYSTTGGCLDATPEIRKFFYSRGGNNNLEVHH